MTGNAAASALSEAYRLERGAPPRKKTLDLLWAQWALETGHGRAMHGYNFGGLKGRGGGSAVLKTRERSGDSLREIDDAFRTYASASRGARDYIHTLAERFPSALSAAERGDGAGFVGALANARYFTARPATYRQAIERLAREHAGATRDGSVKATSFAPLLATLLDGLLRLLARQCLDRGAA